MNPFTEIATLYLVFNDNAWKFVLETARDRYPVDVLTDTDRGHSQDVMAAMERVLLDGWVFMGFVANNGNGEQRPVFSRVRHRQFVTVKPEVAGSKVREAFPAFLVKDVDLNVESEKELTERMFKAGFNLDPIHNLDGSVQYGRLLPRGE